MKKYLDSTICWPLAIVLFILCLISCYTIKCAAGYITYPNPTGYWSKQLLYYMIGVGLIFLIKPVSRDFIVKNYHKPSTFQYPRPTVI